MWGGRCARLLWGRCRRRRHDRRGHVHDQYGHALEEATHRVESVKFQFSARPMQRDGRTSRNGGKAQSGKWLLDARMNKDAFIRSSFTQQRPSDYDSISRFIRHAGLGHQILRERGDIVREIACDAKTELIEVSMCRKFEE